jgi:hypothetical protein
MSIRRFVDRAARRSYGALVGAVVLAAAVPAFAGAEPQAKPDPAASWSAPASTRVVTVEKSFDNGSVRLSGTLVAPVVSRKVPAVIVFHAASVPTRDLPLYRHLQQMLPPLGIAVFVFDRRGSGKSSGPAPDGDFTALADDGVAAQRMLERDPHIDSSRIGFWGLSQGGWLSILAASRSPRAAFAVAVSAPVTTADVQMNFAVANILRIKGYTQPDIDIAITARKAVDDFERGRLDRATAQKRLDAAVAKPWFDLIYMGKTFHDPAQSGWAKEISNDPLATLAKVKAPTLMMYGSRDPWVPVRLSAETLQARAAQHPNVTTVVVDGADHEMELNATPQSEIDPALLAVRAPDAPEYFATVAAWLVRQTRAEPAGLCSAGRCSGQR